MSRLNLRVVALARAQIFAICRLDSDASIPDWAHGEFVATTRTRDELTVVCRQQAVPPKTRCDFGWRCLQLAGKLDLTEVGVIASLTKPLAEAEISVFVIGTFDTDHLLIKDSSLSNAVTVLTKFGHSVRSQ